MPSCSHATLDQPERPASFVAPGAALALEGAECLLEALEQAADGQRIEPCEAIPVELEPSVRVRDDAHAVTYPS